MFRLGFPTPGLTPACLTGPWKLVQAIRAGNHAGPLFPTLLRGYAGDSTRMSGPTASPQTPCVVSDLAVARQILKLHDPLDDYPDTLNVFTNFEVVDEILDQLAS